MMLTYIHLLAKQLGKTGELEMQLLENWIRNIVPEFGLLDSPHAI